MQNIKELVDYSKISGYGFWYTLNGEIDEIDVFATSYRVARQTAETIMKGYERGGELTHVGRVGLTDWSIEGQYERFGLSSFGL